MILQLQAEAPPLREVEGVIYVGKSSIPLERVLRAFLTGATPEQIAHDYDVLAIEDIYATITFFLRHRDEVTAYLATAQRDYLDQKHHIEQRWDPAGVRARLLTRRPAEAG